MMGTSVSCCLPSSASDPLSPAPPAQPEERHEGKALQVLAAVVELVVHSVFADFSTSTQLPSPGCKVIDRDLRLSLPRLIAPEGSEEEGKDLSRRELIDKHHLHHFHPSIISTITCVVCACSNTSKLLSTPPALVGLACHDLPRPTDPDGEEGDESTCGDRREPPEGTSGKGREIQGTGGEGKSEGRDRRRGRSWRQERKGNRKEVVVRKEEKDSGSWEEEQVVMEEGEGDGGDLPGENESRELREK
eukprot:766272-Hanusia_phi.AAC.10